MQYKRSPVNTLLALFVVVGTLAGLVGAYKRFHVESRNGAVEIGLEWQEVTELAQATQTPIASVLKDMKAQGVTALVIQEDTVGGLELAGALHPTKRRLPDGSFSNDVIVDDPMTLSRIRDALKRRGINVVEAPKTRVPGAGTLFTLTTAAQDSPPLYVGVDYPNLRNLGVGLPPDAIGAARVAKLAVAGRISNFPGVSRTSAQAVLAHLKVQGASVVIFSGDEVLGYSGVEKDVAQLLRDPADPADAAAPGDSFAPTGLIYGAVEFGKQRGDEKISGYLHGDLVRVHSIQTAEMGTMDETEVVERFEKAARERNIRFCYVRLITFAGADPVQRNAEYIGAITRAIEHGSRAVGGGLRAGIAARYGQTGVPGYLFALIGLGVAAGTIWMLRALMPVPDSVSVIGFAALALICLVLTLHFGEMGRKLVALLGGIAFPTAACLAAYPGRALAERRTSEAGSRPANIPVCVMDAARGIVLASAVTAIGIVHVVGLLATRPFMVEANQFMGIKAQHGVPIAFLVFVALAGGAAVPGETWAGYRKRALIRLRAAMNEPARFGTLLLGGVALITLAVIIARTGNDAGVGVSGIELKARAVLDRVLPVRPRTKEFLIGHPFFMLGLAWWSRGRRRLAIPCFLVGVLGQVSLLNTFCHIHTPLIISLWRDAIGLIIGAAIGIAIFLLFERAAPAPKSGEPT